MLMERLFTIKEVMDILQLSYSTVYKLVTDGTIKSVQVGRSHRIPQASLRAFILVDCKGGQTNDT